MTGFAYSTNDPAALATYRAAITARAAFAGTLHAACAAMPGVEGAQGWAGTPGTPDQIAALWPDGTGVVPDGWQLSGNTARQLLTPRRGKPGQPARDWLAAHQPVDVNHLMRAHGLPYRASESVGGRWLTVYPHPFEHDGTLWVRYGVEPNENIFGDGPCTWTPCKLSDFFLAFEAHTDANKAEPVPTV